MINKPSLSIIIPAFNEEENINYSHDKLIKVIEILIEKKKIQRKSYKIIYIDDGSEDNTWRKVQALCKSMPTLKG